MYVSCLFGSTFHVVPELKSSDEVTGSMFLKQFRGYDFEGCAMLEGERGALFLKKERSGGGGGVGSSSSSRPHPWIPVSLLAIRPLHFVHPFLFRAFLLPLLLLTALAHQPHCYSTSP
jgi:hypothetical protein